MRSVSLHLAAAAVLLLLLVCASHRVCAHEVGVCVGTDSTVLTERCIGGDVGLTNTSILVQYRVLETVSMDPMITEVLDWKFLAEIDVSQGIAAQILNFTVNDTEQGVQIRFLQLEHGGGECNCWNFTKNFAIYLDGADSIFISGCTITPVHNLATICGLSASEPRGATTIGYYFTGSDGEMCPGNSSVGLISDQGPPLPQNCATTSPRM